MTVPAHLLPDVLRAYNALGRQQKLDSDMVVSEMDGDGRVQIEGTVDLATLVAAIHTKAPTDG